MSIYSKFQKCMGVAMGKLEAQAAKAAMIDDPDAVSASGPVEPEDQIQTQADKIAECIGIYMKKRGTEVSGTDVVSTPWSPPDEWPEGV